MKIYFKNLIILLMLSFLCTDIMQAQTKDNFTNDAMVVADNGASVVIRSSGIHKKKKTAVQMAVMSAFDTFFFSGIDGLNNGQPVITGRLTDAQKYYLQRIFNQERYVQFVSDVKEDEDARIKLPDKTYKATVQFTLYYNALKRDLIRSKVMKQPETSAEKVESMPMFTMTIVPFKQGYDTYSDVLRTKADVRPVISRIENSLKQKGYNVKDFLAVVDAADRDMQFEMDMTAASNDKMLVNQTQADVYITVDVQEVTDFSGGEGVVTLKAYEVSTGNILCSDFGRSKHYKKYNTVALYERALEECLDRFITQLTDSWSKKDSKGKMYTVRFSISPESLVTMAEEVGTELLPLSSVLTEWVKEHSVGNKYHMIGYTDEGIFFDQIYIKDGAELQFSNELYRYLRDELGLNSSCTRSGNTYYITIE